MSTRARTYDGISGWQGAPESIVAAFTKRTPWGMLIGCFLLVLLIPVSGLLLTFAGWNATAEDGDLCGAMVLTVIGLAFLAFPVFVLAGASRARADETGRAALVQAFADDRAPATPMFFGTTGSKVVVREGKTLSGRSKQVLDFPEAQVRVCLADGSGLKIQVTRREKHKRGGRVGEPIFRVQLVWRPRPGAYATDRLPKQKVIDGLRLAGTAVGANPGRVVVANQRGVVKAKWTWTGSWKPKQVVAMAEEVAFHLGKLRGLPSDPPPVDGEASADAPRSRKQRRGQS